MVEVEPEWGGQHGQSAGGEEAGQKYIGANVYVTCQDEEESRKYSKNT